MDKSSSRLEHRIKKKTDTQRNDFHIDRLENDVILWAVDGEWGYEMSDRYWWMRTRLHRFSFPWCVVVRCPILAPSSSTSTRRRRRRTPAAIIVVIHVLIVVVVVDSVDLMGGGANNGDLSEWKMKMTCGNVIAPAASAVSRIYSYNFSYPTLRWHWNWPNLCVIVARKKVSSNIYIYVGWYRETNARWRLVSWEAAAPRKAKRSNVDCDDRL